MNKLLVSVSPHIRQGDTTATIMRDVLIALVPALVASVIFFGARALLVAAVTIAACVLSEWGFEKITGRENTIYDLSAAVTGLLLALNLPVDIPIWQAIFGSAAAIIMVKQLFGGIGKNFANPAITARVIMLIAFAGPMTTWRAVGDAVSSATPLALIKAGDISSLPPLMQMFVGQRGGSLGETSVLALLLGGAYLLYRKVITWHTPVAFIGTVFIFTALLGEQPVYQIMSGGLILGAFFMATDYSTTPSTPLGQIIFGIGCGLITVLIRVWGNYPEGVSFSILLMNILTPYISKLTKRKPIGGVKA